jgi:hypothetical protein
MKTNSWQQFRKCDSREIFETNGHQPGCGAYRVSYRHDAAFFRSAALTQGVDRTDLDGVKLNDYGFDLAGYVSEFAIVLHDATSAVRSVVANWNSRMARWSLASNRFPHSRSAIADLIDGGLNGDIQTRGRYITGAGSRIADLALGNCVVDRLFSSPHLGRPLRISLVEVLAALDEHAPLFSRRRWGIPQWGSNPNRSRALPTVL